MKRYTYINDQIYGDYEEYYGNGKLFKKCVYVADKIHGEYIEYYDNGQIMEKTNYNNGRKQGWILVYKKLIFLDNLYTKFI